MTSETFDAESEKGAIEVGSRHQATIIARGQTSRGQPITMVIGLPAQLASNMYGGL